MPDTSAKVISVATLALIVFAALGPANWVPRSGLGWKIDHIVGYSVFTWMCCLAWPRPIVVGGALMAFAMLLEALQAFTPDRHPDLHAALYNAGAVLAAALVAEFFMRAPRRLTPRMLLMAQSGLVRGVWQRNHRHRAGSSPNQFQSS